MCTQQLPFSRENNGATANAIINGPHAPITQSQYSNELKFLIDELLIKNPDGRPSIEELIDEPIIKNAIDALVNEFEDDTQLELRKYLKKKNSRPN